jgi:hypothetical protein
MILKLVRAALVTHFFSEVFTVSWLGSLTSW